MNMMNTAGAIPIPNHNMENGIHAIGGIGLNILITKLDNLSNLSDHPIIIPNNTPTTDAKTIPIITLYNVSHTSVNNSPVLHNFMKELTTSTGPGNIYDGNTVNTSANIYHTITIRIGKINLSSPI